MSLQDLAVKLAAIKALKDRLATMEGETKAALMSDHGRGTLYPRIEGREVATVTVSKGSAGKWSVVDERAFLAWVKANRPAALEQSVRSSDRAAILAAIETTGELPDGVTFTDDGKPFVSVRQTDDQAAALLTAWRAGLVEIDVTTPVGAIEDTGSSP